MRSAENVFRPRARRHPGRPFGLALLAALGSIFAGAVSAVGPDAASAAERAAAPDVRLAFAKPPADTAKPAPTPSQVQDLFKVQEQTIDDLKSVFATVRSRDLIDARARTPGTVVTLKVDEGSDVKAGQMIAIVADDKIAIKIRALDAQIMGIESRLRTAKTELDRSEELKKRGVSPQSRVDQARTAFEVATNEAKSAAAERAVLEEQIKEGQVLSPADGRVLRVPVTAGSVVTSGESLATIAANAYLLRIEMPERHARYTKTGDLVKIGARGQGAKGGIVSEGRIVQVYPELRNGRVVADAEVPGLSDYYIGERAVTWVSAGQRRAFVVPRKYVMQKFGQDFVRVKRGNGSADVIVQLGRETPLLGHSDGVEVLSGIGASDVLVRP